MRVPFTSKNKKIQSKVQALECSQHVYWDVSRRSRAANSAVHGPNWPNFELIRDDIVVLVTCNNEVDPIKNEYDRVFTALYIQVSDAQGQLTT